MIMVHQLWRFMGFKKLNLHQNLLDTLEKMGLSIPTSVQKEAIPIILSGHDLQASAQTGTGKTAAFVLPSLQRLIENKNFGKGPRLLILTPTRELAAQVSKEVTKFSAGFPALKTVCIFGGTPYHVQNKQLRRPFDILVATPGRLIDQLERNQINLSHVETFILDEADRMLDMGFIEPVMQIAKKIKSNHQTLLFSATLKGAVYNLAEKLLKNPHTVTIEPTKEEHVKIEESFISASDLNHKYTLLCDILRRPDLKQAIVFTATKRSADRLAEKLEKEGFDAAALHGDMRQRQREKTIKLVRIGKIKILVATDVAARGIDILTITHIINFDLPMTAEDYVHRIGRTGRAGATGMAFSLATKKDYGILRDIEKFTGQTIPLCTRENSEKRSLSPRKNFSNHAPFFGNKTKKFKSKRTFWKKEKRGFRKSF